MGNEDTRTDAGEDGGEAEAGEKAAAVGEQQAPVEREFSDLEVEKFEDDNPVTDAQKVSYLANQNSQIRDNVAQWQRYAAQLEQRMEQLQSRASNRQRTEPEADEAGNDGVQTQRGRASADEPSDMIRRLEERITGLEGQLDQKIRTVEDGWKGREIRSQVRSSLEAAQAKHGKILSELDIISEMNEHPHLTPTQATARFLSRRLGDMKEMGYVVARPKRPAPDLPGSQHLGRPPSWTPPKLPESEDEWAAQARQYRKDKLNDE